MFGYGGTSWAIDAIRSEDTAILLVIGSGLSQRDTMQWDPKMLPSKALIQIDFDPLIIGRTWPGEVAVVANVGEALQRLAAIKDATGLESGRAQRRAFLEGIRARGPNRHQPEDTKNEAIPMHPAQVVANFGLPFRTTACCVWTRAHIAPGFPNTGTCASRAPTTP